MSGRRRRAPSPRADLRAAYRRVRRAVAGRAAARPLTVEGLHEVHRQLRRLRLLALLTSPPRTRGGAGTARAVRRLSRLASDLGRVRDRDVGAALLGRLRSEGVLPPGTTVDRAIEALRRQGARGRSRLPPRLRSAATDRLLSAIPEGTNDRGPPTATRRVRYDPLRLAEAMRRRLGRALRRALDRSSPRRLHRLRKRLRELDAALGLGTSRGRRGASVLPTRSRKWARRLGALHDLAVLGEWIARRYRSREGRRLARTVLALERKERRRIVRSLRRASLPG